MASRPSVRGSSPAIITKAISTVACPALGEGVGSGEWGVGKGRPRFARTHSLAIPYSLFPIPYSLAARHRHPHRNLQVNGPEAHVRKGHVHRKAAPEVHNHKVRRAPAGGDVAALGFLRAEALGHRRPIRTRGLG